MHFLLSFSILVVILQSSFSVHPGDPFPTDQFKSKTLTSEDLINANEIIDSVDDKTSSTTNLINPIDNEINPIDNVISTSTKFIPVTEVHKKDVEGKITIDKKPLFSIIKPTVIPKSNDNDNVVEKSLSSSSSQESSTLSPTKPISKKNLIKIGRWKHEDPLTNKIRYWYEPEGGRMGTGWNFDGYIFQAYNKSESDTEPVYAFHSEIRSIWTNTIQMDPQPPIIGNDQWISDGVSFYAYKISMNSTKVQPVIRYWNKLKHGTTDANETRVTYLMIKKENNNNNNEERLGWTFDKILFYALPIDD